MSRLDSPSLLPQLRGVIALVLGCWLSLGMASTATAQRAIVLVRHAEKIDESPQALLSPVGHKRAAALAELLAPLAIRAIFVTELERTRQTAQPLASKLGLTPTLVAKKERAALLTALRALPADATALVVSHSDILPLLLRELGVQAPIALEGSDYSSLFIVVPLPAAHRRCCACSCPSPSPPPPLTKVKVGSSPLRKSPLTCRT